MKPRQRHIMQAAGARRGAALILALFFVSMVGVLSVTVGDSITTQVAMARAQSRTTQAQLVLLAGQDMIRLGLVPRPAGSADLTDRLPEPLRVTGYRLVYEPAQGAAPARLVCHGAGAAQSLSLTEVR